RGLDESPVAQQVFGNRLAATKPARRLQEPATLAPVDEDARVTDRVVRSIRDQFDGLLQVAGQEGVVRVEQGDELAARFVDAAVARAIGPGLLLPDVSHAGVVDGLNGRLRVVGRPVVDDEDLDVFDVLVEGRSDCRSHGSGAIVRGNDDADDGRRRGPCLRHGSSPTRRVWPSSAAPVRAYMLSVPLLKIRWKTRSIAPVRSAIR